MQKAALKVLTVLLLSVQAWGSQGLSINDQILSDYRNAKTFKEFVEKLTKNGFPGDYQYVQQVWKAYPELLKDKSLPKMNFEKGEFILRDGLSETRLKKLPEFGAFQINGKKVVFGIYDKTSAKMKKIIEATKGRKSVHFALMPVVWAAENQGVPNKLVLADVALVSLLTQMEGLPEDSQKNIKNDVVEFRLIAQVEFDKKVKKECLPDIEATEQSFGQEVIPYHYLRCELGNLDVELQKTDSEGYYYGLNLGTDRLTVRRSKDPLFKEGLQTFVYDRQTTDADTAMNKGYGEDEPVAATSSPFQREEGFLPKAKNGADLEIFNRFQGIASDKSIRQLCSKKCESSVNAYANLQVAYDANIAAVKEAQRKSKKDAKADHTK